MTERLKKAKIDAADRRNISSIRDREGNFVIHAQNAENKAEELVSRDVTNINDWRSTMMSLLNMCLSLAQKLETDIDKSFKIPLFHRAGTAQKVNTDVVTIPSLDIILVLIQLKTK